MCLQLLKILIFITLVHQSTQHNSTSHSTIIQGVCIYGNTFDNYYTCNLSVGDVLNPTDVIEISGTHTFGRTDADVLAVTHFASTLQYFNGEILRKFVNLQHIVIQQQELRVITPNAFEFCPNLRQLITAFDPIENFPSRMLENCRNLRIFTAIGHSFMQLPEDIFGQIDSLVDFQVQNNQLTSLPNRLLENMRGIRRFNAHGNQLNYLSPNLLKNAENLQEFIVSRNFFRNQTIITAAIENHQNLQTIRLDNNNFPNFDFIFFSQFQNLNDLSVGSTVGPMLTGIEWQMLPSRLSVLNVEGIGENIPQNAFSHLIGLTTLRLSGSGIQNIHSSTLSTLRSLRTLSIQNTNIQVLPADLFINNANIQSLSLDNNRIEILPPGIFAPLRNLGASDEFQSFSISGNNIQRLNINSFSQHGFLRRIWFNFNRINEIERGLFSRFHSNLTFAGFTSNACINRFFNYQSNLDHHEDLLLCFNNWAGVTTQAPTTGTTDQDTTSIGTTTLGTTTPSDDSEPDGCGYLFSKFQVLMIILTGLLINLLK
jgi:Leucine-rich repeat (LRR) protein